MSDIDVDHILQLERDLQSARESTIKLLLERQKETGEQLKLLGHERSQPRTRRSKKACSKCGAADHDARSHRGTRVKDAAAS